MENYEPTNIYNKMKYLSMDQGYVFYPSIEQYDGFGNIEKALNHRILQAGGSYTAVGKELLDMAEAERQKETLYLDQTFNFKFAFPLDFDADKNLFTVINECMQTSKIFKRHLAKFQHGYENNHKVIQPVAMVIGFGDYFMKTCDENLGNLFDRLEGNLDGDYTNIVNKWARDMVKLTIIAMLDSHVIGSKTRNEADPYYEDLRQVVQDIEDNENKWISGIYELYKIDKLEEELKKKIENGENIYNIDKKDRTKIERQIFTDAGISSSSAQKGGFLMELIMSMVQEHLVKAEGDNVHFNVIHSGDTKVRPDITITTKLEIESIFQGAFKTIREENITDRESINKIYNDINEKLEKIDSGWIVHENLKNYSLGGDFFESLGGFSAGSAIPITTFKALLESNNAAGINPAQLVGLVKQMIPGSWMIKNQGYMRDVVKDFVGSAISHFLFDDIATVGQTMERFKGVTGHQIHLFYLDGFFVPLSLYLRLLGEAFTEAEQNIDELVRVDIKTPGSITYQKKEDLQAQGISQLWTSAEWEQQREDADAITISYHFLHNFVNLIHELTS